MDKKILSIIIADDYPMILEGLFKELTSSGYHVIGQAVDGMQALELIIKLQPDIAILDIDMPFFNGFEVVKMAKEKRVATKFIIQSFHKEPPVVMHAKAIHIHGFLLKEDSFSEIEKCIKAVASNTIYYSPSLNSDFLTTLDKNLFSLKLLTFSELTILKLISQQQNTNSIAEQFNVSVRTIEKHRSNIIKKLEIEGETKRLTYWAIENKKIILDM